MGVAKVCFIPHPDNNHWPLVLRHRSLAYVSVLLVLIKIATIAAIGLTPNLARLSTITEARMIQLTNQARKDAGLPALSVNSKLAQAAALKGQDMLKHEYFAHISPSGVTPWFWMKKTAYDYSVAGENLAIDFGEAEDVVSAWQNSPSHKANLLHKEYTETGIAVVSGDFQGGTSIIVVHMFGRPLHAAESDEVPAAIQQQEDLRPTVEATPALQGDQPEPTSLPAPHTPRIALTHAPKDSNDNALFTIDGTSGEEAALLIGNQERTSGTVPPHGKLEIVLSSSSLPQGTVIARAIVKNSEGLSSAPSAPLSFINPKPLIANAYSLLLSPAFDQEIFALAQSGGLYPPQIFSARAKIAVDTHVISATPSFTVQGAADEKTFLTTFLHDSRQLAGIVTLVLMFLLALAIFIRMHVQHPALIAHASVIILFALRFLLA